MIARLRRLQQRRNFQEINKFPRGLSLDDTSAVCGGCVVHDLGLEGGGGVGYCRGVSEWDVGEAVDTGTAAGEDAVDEGGTGGFNTDDGFDELGGLVCDQPGHETAL